MEKGDENTKKIKIMSAKHKWTQILEYGVQHGLCLMNARRYL